MPKKGYKPTAEHKKKLSDKKKEYYKNYKGKRPYSTQWESNYTLEELKKNIKGFIALFNDINHTEGDISEETLNRIYKRSKDI